MNPLQTLQRNDPKQPLLRYRLHSPEGTPKAAVLLTPGYADHQERFSHVVKAWTDRGLLVATQDLRGHGESEGPRGHINSFHDYVQDYLELLDHLAREPVWSAAGKPVLFGHSLGGLITFHVALAAPERFRGVALSSPFFGLALRVPLYKRIPARALSKFLPRFALPSGLSGSDVTTDKALALAYDNDPKVFKTATARWFTEVMNAQRSALQRAPELKLPLVALLAGDDRVASTEAARQVLAAVSSVRREVQVLPGHYHEVLNEAQRDRWIAYLAEQMLAWSEG